MLLEPDLPGVSTVLSGTDTVIGEATFAGWTAGVGLGAAVAGNPASEPAARERPREAASARRGFMG